MTRREEMERDLLDLFECEPRANMDRYRREILRRAKEVPSE